MQSFKSFLKLAMISSLLLSSTTFKVFAAPKDIANRHIGPWVRLVTRSHQQFKKKQIGGTGMQFIRSFAVSPARPNYLLGAMDQNGPWASKDFGRSFFSADWRQDSKQSGLVVGRHGLSAWIDPEDPDRQLLLYGHDSRTPYKDHEGIYLSTDGGKTSNHVHFFKDMVSTQSMRMNTSLIAHAPGRTPNTRRIYAMYVAVPSGVGGTPTTETIQLYVSNDGGSAWSAVGSKLNTSIYANGQHSIYGIAVAPNNDLYMWGARGAWRSPAGSNLGKVWNQLKTFSNGSNAVYRMDVSAGNGIVWAAVENVGLKKSTNHGSSSSVVLALTDIQDFSISSVNRSKILACRKTFNREASYSHNGGKSWASVKSINALGEEHFTGALSGGAVQFVWHPKKENIVFAHRFQNMGISYDGGVTFRPAGAFYDGSHTRGIAFHSKDWRKFLFTQQDKGSIYTGNGGLSWIDDEVSWSNPLGLELRKVLDNPYHLSGGSGIMTAKGRSLVAIGQHPSRRGLLLFDPNTSSPVGDVRIYKDGNAGAANSAQISPTDVNIAFIGSTKVTNLNAIKLADVKFTDIGKQFIGATVRGGRSVIYAVDQSGNNRIYRSTDMGRSWNTWYEHSGSIRPFVDQSVAIVVDPNSSARLYVATPNGKVIKVEGWDRPYSSDFFDALSEMPNAKLRQVNDVAVDPHNPNLAYVSMTGWGSARVFRTTDGGMNWKNISKNLPRVDGELFIHPLTSDVFFGSSHGTFVKAPPAGHAKKYKLSGSVYKRIKSYLKKAVFKKK